MNSKTAKKIRSEVNHKRKEILVSVMRELMQAPLRERLRFCWRILRQK